MQSALSLQWKKEGIFRVRGTLQIPTYNLKELSLTYSGRLNVLFALLMR
jgi:hypothetical protein